MLPHRSLLQPTHTFFVLPPAPLRSATTTTASLAPLRSATTTAPLRSATTTTASLAPLTMAAAYENSSSELKVGDLIVDQFRALSLAGIPLDIDQLTECHAWQEFTKDGLKVYYTLAKPSNTRHFDHVSAGLGQVVTCAPRSGKSFTPSERCYRPMSLDDDSLDSKAVSWPIEPFDMRVTPSYYAWPDCMGNHATNAPAIYNDGACTSQYLLYSQATASNVQQLFAKLTLALTDHEEEEDALFAGAITKVTAQFREMQQWIDRQAGWIPDDCGVWMLWSEAIEDLFTNIIAKMTTKTIKVISAVLGSDKALNRLSSFQFNGRAWPGCSAGTIKLLTNMEHHFDHSRRGNKHRNADGDLEFTIGHSHWRTFNSPARSPYADVLNSLGAAVKLALPRLAVIDPLAEAANAAWLDKKESPLTTKPQSFRLIKANSKVHCAKHTRDAFRLAMTHTFDHSPDSGRLPWNNEYAVAHKTRPPRPRAIAPAPASPKQPAARKGRKKLPNRLSHNPYVNGRSRLVVTPRLARIISGRKAEYIPPHCEGIYEAYTHSGRTWPRETLPDWLTRIRKNWAGQHRDAQNKTIKRHVHHNTKSLQESDPSLTKEECKEQTENAIIDLLTGATTDSAFILKYPYSCFDLAALDASMAIANDMLRIDPSDKEHMAMADMQLYAFVGIEAGKAEDEGDTVIDSDDEEDADAQDARMDAAADKDSSDDSEVFTEEENEDEGDDEDEDEDEDEDTDDSVRAISPPPTKKPQHKKMPRKSVPSAGWPRKQLYPSPSSSKKKKRTRIESGDDSDTEDERKKPRFSPAPHVRVKSKSKKKAATKTKTPAASDTSIFD